MTPAFEVACDRINLRHARTLATFYILALLAWWPFEAWVLSDPEVLTALAQFRLTHLSFAAAVLLVFTVSAWARQHPVTVAGVAAVPMIATASAIMGRLGGVDAPWLYTSYLMPFASVVLLMPVGRRIAWTFGLIAVFLAAWFGWNPGHLDHPLVGAPFLFLSAVGCFAVAGGHLHFHLTWLTFRQRRELETFNERLQKEVERKTAALRHLGQHLQRAQEEERKRLARDLHDHTGQALTAMRIELGVTGSRADDGPERIRESLARLDTLLDDVFGNVRGILEGLRPPIIDDEGLGPAAAWLVDRLSRGAGIQAHLTAELDGHEPAPEVAMGFFRILQEALTNVVRHSGASVVTVFIGVRSGALTLEVTDNGKGFDPPPGRLEGSAVGMGILGMRERAVAIGATLELSNTPDGGARLLLIRSNP